MKSAQRKSGFTLLEILFASAVMLISTSMLVSLSINVAQFGEEEQMQNEIERETSLLLDYMERDIKSAVAVVADYPGDVSYSDFSIVLKLPEFDESGLPIADAFDYVLYEYSQDSEKVFRTVFDDAEAGVEKKSIGIDVGRCFFTVLADGEPTTDLSADRAAKTIEVEASRYDDVRQRYYNRSFVIASTLRNPE
jgi:prepilin-type N-terminal cleavage/methylation domain-containing protein